MNTDKIYAEKLASEYAKKDDRKVVELKKLDRKAKLPAEIFTYTFGVVAALIFGLGMCMAMKVVGNSTITMVFGIIIGVIAMALMSVNYPIYKKLQENGKKKYSTQIIDLANEIASDDKE